ncbi:MAG: PAS domain S-box protein [Methanoregulaceae archaeon]|nr:PAS domain S-box protein [Methanoregulaceae archaeon]
MISVLLVDEEPEILEMTREFLERTGDFRITSSQSVGEALHRMESERFEAIVSDYDMPGMNGIDFLRILRSRGDETPFIIFTGKGREHVAMEALNNGADFYLQKGGDPRSQFAELGNLIRKAVNERFAVNALHESDRRLRETLENIRLIAVQIDLDNRVTFCNRYLLELTGWSAEEVIGKDWFEVFVPEKDRKEVRSTLHAVLIQAQVDLYHEGEIVTRTGEVRYIAWNNTVLRDTNGLVIGISSIGEDVTERRKAEEELIESKRRYQSLFESANDAVFIADADSGRLLDANRKAQEMTGRSLEEIRTMHQTDLHPREEESRYSAMFGRDAEVCEGVNEAIVLNRDGRRIPVIISSKCVTLSGRRIMLAIFHDISERKNAEAIQAMLAAIVQSSEDAIIGEDLNERITAWNSGAEKLYGYSAPEMIGRTIDNLLPVEEKTKRDAIIGMIKRGERVEHHETRRIRKDGSVVEVSVSFSPILASDGSITGIAYIARDMTRQREMEKAFIGYITEAASRLKNPIELIGSRLSDIAEQVCDDRMSGEEIQLQLRTQVRNIDQVVKNINELNRVILEDYRNVPEGYRKYLIE